MGLLGGMLGMGGGGGLGSAIGQSAGRLFGGSPVGQTPRMPMPPMRQAGLLPTSQQRPSMQQMMTPQPMNVQIPPRPQAPQVNVPPPSYFQNQRAGIANSVMDAMSSAFGINTAHAGGAHNLNFTKMNDLENARQNALGSNKPGDATMSKGMTGAPKGASFAGGDVQGTSQVNMMPVSKLNPSDNAANAIQKFEGYYEKPYWDYKQWTVGYGSRASGPNDTVTKDEAHQRLMNEMDEYAGYVRDNVKVPLTQNQFDALTSFVYNVGPGGIKGSTVQKRLNEGDYRGAADAMMMWDKAGGKTLEGLKNRREAERKLFLQGM